MRINRSKVVRKCLKFFRIVYHIEEPYDIILDADFIKECLSYKIDIYDRLLKLLQCSNIKLHILKTALDELIADKGPLNVQMVDFARSRCTIIDDTKLVGESPSARLVTFQYKIQNEYIQASIKHKIKRYFIATQDGDIRTDLRKIPGVPIIYANKVTLVLEAPSETSRKFNANVIELNKTKLNTQEVEIVEKAKVFVEKKSIQSNLVSSVIKVTEHDKRKRKAIGVNPLSNKAPDENSKSSKRKKVELYKRR